jgi:hypothetical protein
MMLPFGVAFGFDFAPLFVDAFFPCSLGIRVVCVFWGSEGNDFTRVEGVLEAALVAISAGIVEFESERGGEGGRPTEGVNGELEGSLRFSRGFLNMEETSHEVL